MPEAPSQRLGIEHDLKHVVVELSRRLFPKCGLGGILRPVHIVWKTMYQTAKHTSRPAQQEAPQTDFIQKLLKNEIPVGAGVVAGPR